MTDTTTDSEALEGFEDDSQNFPEEFDTRRIVYGGNPQQDVVNALSGFVHWLANLPPEAAQNFKPYTAIYNKFNFAVWTYTVDELLEMRRAFGMKDKFADDSHIGFYKDFGGGIVRIRLYLARSQACEAVDTGETEVYEYTETISPAVVRKVKATRAKVRWECKPLLGGGVASTDDMPNEDELEAAILAAAKENF